MHYSPLQAAGAPPLERSQAAAVVGNQPQQACMGGKQSSLLGICMRLIWRIRELAEARAND